MGNSTLCRYGQKSRYGEEVTGHRIERVGMKKDQFIAVLFWIGLGVFVSIFSYRFGLGSFRSPGPGLMPFLLGLLLCGLSLYYLGTSLAGKNHEKDPDSAAKEQGHGETSPKKIIIVIVSLIAYALALEKLGYLVATSILLFILFWTAGSKKLTAVLSSIITVLLSYFVFAYLGVSFPQGMLKFLGV